MLSAEFAEHVRGRLIVSCQPVIGGPLDATQFVVAFALAALDGGAAGLRIEGVQNIAAVRAATDAPIIGLVKRDLVDSQVRITPAVEDVQGIVTAGADLVAYDATLRARPRATADLIAAARDAGRVTMADCASVADARAALAEGADFVGSTLSGYTGGLEPKGPDLALVRQLRELTPNVIAEGRIRAPEEAAAAISAGAMTVVVGSAITRPELVTSWYAAEVERAAGLMTGTSAA